MWFKYGQIEVDGGDENDYGSCEYGDEGGDGHAEGTSPAALLSPPLHSINNTPNNQSKPIVPTPSLSLLITSRYNSITFHYNHYNY